METTTNKTTKTLTLDNLTKRVDDDTLVIGNDLFSVAFTDCFIDDNHDGTFTIVVDECVDIYASNEKEVIDYILDHWIESPSQLHIA